MLNEEYTAVPFDENEYFGTPLRRDAPVGNILKAMLVLFLIVIGCFAVGFGVGQNWSAGSLRWERVGEDGLLPPQTFLPDSMMALY
jgi:hypothetical protein